MKNPLRIVLYWATGPFPGTCGCAACNRTAAYRKR